MTCCLRQEDSGDEVDKTHFPYQGFCTGPHFDTEAKGNLEVALFSSPAPDAAILLDHAKGCWRRPKGSRAPVGRSLQGQVHSRDEQVGFAHTVVQLPNWSPFNSLSLCDSN